MKTAGSGLGWIMDYALPGILMGAISVGEGILPRPSISLCARAALQITQVAVLVNTVAIFALFHLKNHRRITSYLAPTRTQELWSPALPMFFRLLQLLGGTRAACYHRHRGQGALLSCPFQCLPLSKASSVLHQTPAGAHRVRPYDLKAPNNLLYAVLYTIQTIHYIL